MVFVIDVNGRFPVLHNARGSHASDPGAARGSSRSGAYDVGLNIRPVRRGDLPSNGMGSPCDHASQIGDWEVLLQADPVVTGAAATGHFGPGRTQRSRHGCAGVHAPEHILDVAETTRPWRPGRARGTGRSGRTRRTSWSGGTGWPRRTGLIPMNKNTAPPADWGHEGQRLR